MSNNSKGGKGGGQSDNKSKKSAQIQNNQKSTQQKPQPKPQSQPQQQPHFSESDALRAGDLDAAVAASLEQFERDKARYASTTFSDPDAEFEMAIRASEKSYHEYDSWEVVSTRPRKSRSDKESALGTTGAGQVIGRAVPNLPILQPHLHLPPLERELCRHIFIDNSNLFYGLKSRNWWDKRIRLSIPKFTRLMELGPDRTKDEEEGSEYEECRIGKRVVIGSTGPAMLWEQYANAGYTCNKVPAGKEETADSLLQAAAFNLILEVSDDPEQYGRHTIVIASGDGNDHNVDSSFVDVAERAAMKGFRVEIWSWQGCLSKQFRRKAERFQDNRISMHILDDHFEAITYSAKPLGSEGAEQSGEYSNSNSNSNSYAGGGGGGDGGKGGYNGGSGGDADGEWESFPAAYATSLPPSFSSSSSSSSSSQLPTPFPFKESGVGPEPFSYAGIAAGAGGGRGGIIGGGLGVGIGVGIIGGVIGGGFKISSPTLSQFQHSTTTIRSQPQSPSPQIVPSHLFSSQTHYPHQQQQQPFIERVD
jgi:hypothetical protein